jgi:hypothetical protein
MTSSTRAAALLIGVLVGSFTAVALAVFRVTLAVLERRDDRRAGLPHAAPPAPHHARESRHRADGRRTLAEVFAWAVGLAVRFYRSEDGGPKAAVLLASLFVAFSVLIGAAQ